MDVDKDSLKIGDYVYLRDVNLGCYLSVEGIISEDLVGVRTIKDLQDSLFCVHLQRQYSAYRELNVFLEGYGMDKSKITDEGEQSYYQALERGRANENVLNEQYLKQKHGQVVLFGDVVQLFHVKSRKYLQVLTGKLAKVERENTRVALDVNGSTLSWVQIYPRFRIDKEGDRILTNTEVYLKVPERSNEYIHSADRDEAIDHDREVNCSLEMTSWRVSIYQSSSDTMNSKNLLASQLVYITDPESGSCLTIAQQKVETLDDMEREDNSGKEESEVGVKEDDGVEKSNGDEKPIANDDDDKSKKSVPEKADENDEDSGDDEGKYFHEFGDIVFEPKQNQIDSNFLWFLETSTRMLGGPISWKTDLVRFKHMNSGKYLMVERIREEDSQKKVDDGNESVNSFGSFGAEKIIFTAIADGEELPSTLFNIHEVSNGDKCLENGKAIQIGHNGNWINRGDLMKDTVSTFTACSIRDNLSAVNLIIQRFDHSSGDDDPEAEKTSKEPLDVFAGQSARMYINKFYEMIFIPDDIDGVSTIWPSGHRSDIEFFKVIAEKTILFSQGFSMSAVNIKIGSDKADAALRSLRQNLLREQGTVEIIIRMIKKLTRISDLQDSGLSDDSPLIKMGRTILEMVFNILYYSLVDNASNQIYVADYLPVLLDHLSSQKLAGKCVTEMLSKNMELQETKIGTREIQIFVKKLRTSKMNAMYLNLLQSCCSCEGDGVDANQCKVANMLFDGHTEDIIMNLYVDKNTTRKVSWESPKDLYLNAPVASESVIRGETLLSKGLPCLYVVWVGKDTDDSIQKYAAPIEDIFPGTVPTETLCSQKALPPDIMLASNLNPKMKKKIANYFVAEMFLGAEMSMDRNYVAMHKMDEIFSFETLVTIMKMDLSYSVQSAAVRLLMCQHIDRDPQACSKIPCLTRTWGDIKKHAEPQLPYVDMRRRHTFGLVQTLISEHVSKMGGKRWDERSLHILKLLNMMAQFNFYGTTEKMKDLIQPLLAALDRRNVQVIDSDDQDSVSTKGDLHGVSKMSFSVEDLGVAQHDDVDENSSISSENETAFLSKGPGFLNFRGCISGQTALKFLFNYSFAVLAVLTVLSDIYFSVADPHLYETWSMDSIEFIVEIVLLSLMAMEQLIAIVATFIDMKYTEKVSSVYNRRVAILIDIAVVFACFLILFLKVPKVYLLLIAVRFLRLYILFPIASQIESGGAEDDTRVAEYKTPVRYAKVQLFELETMVEAVNILAFVLRIIEDRNISLLLRNFYLWESGSDKRSPSELFEQAITDSEQLSLAMEGFDYVMTDILMFVHPPLTQSSLEVLMAHYSQRRNLLKNARGVQLLASSKREKQYRKVDEMLQELEQNAETQELWGELETEADYEQSKRTKDILIELTEMCKVRSFVLEFGEDYLPDVDVQNLYRNLGGFEICMKVIGLHDSVEEDENGDLSEQALNTKDVCRLCNHLLYWFLLRNPQNQELGYDELEFFFDTLDEEIDSHLVIAATFSANETLMKRVPQKLISDMVDNIMKNGKSHHYLTLLASISHAGDKEVSENQFEIIKALTSPGRLQNISSFFVPVTDPEYQIKKELMKPFLNSSLDVSIDDLPPLLAYHLKFLEVLSGCTVGRATLTTVEAKVQSVFSYVDIVESMLDSGTILMCKNLLGMFFYNSIIEVELKIPGLEQSSCVWRLLDSFVPVMTYAKDDMRLVEKLGWEDEQVSRVKIEYIFTCIQIAGGFFSRYYDPQSFRFNDKSSTTGDKVDISLTQVNELILTLFTKFQELYDLDSPRLSTESKAAIFSAMESLNNKASKIIVSNLQPKTSLLQDAKNNSALTNESKLISKYNDFLDAIEADSELNQRAETENVAFISVIEALPSVRIVAESDVRYETLLKKLIQSIRDSIQFDKEQKQMSSRDTKTATWTVRSFRTMIENKMGMNIFERDEGGGEEQDDAAADVIAALSSCGATTLCLDLIADGIDEELQLESIRLGVALLLKEGGALGIQKEMNEYFRKSNSEPFFRMVRMTLQKLQTWHKWHQIIILKEGEDPKPPEDLLIVRFLQLMCEGHFMPNQDIMREQPNNKLNYNLLDDFVNYLNCLSRLPCRTSTCAANRVAATILEVIQGPCEGNQAHFALNTELIETLNRINRAKIVNDCVDEEEVELKKSSIDIFQGVLEGQGEKSVVYERVLSVIHLDIIQMMSLNATVTNFGNDSPPELTEEQQILKTECIVLLQMLCNFKPSLYDELGISRNVEDIVGSGTAMIEVIWRGDIHRRFFHVPNICSYLAKSSKDKLIETVDRTNSENKLIDFLFRSHKLYMEVKHQQLLTEMNLSGIFSRKNLDYASWATFVIAILINILFIIYYDATSGSAIIKDPNAEKVVYALNICQTIFAGIVMIIWLVVRTPVEYEFFKSAGNSQFRTIFLTATEGFTIYYFLYLVLSILGLTVSDVYLPFLLLDIIAKNSTTRDVLNAVLIPWKQLSMTMVLCFFMTYIYSFFLFLFYGQDIGGVWGVGVFPGQGEDDCHILFGCFKFALSYGLRQGGGLTDVLNLSINHGRWLMDETYFLLVIIMLLNIIFGIIIDTFSSLRAAKEARELDTEEVCFICGIDKQIFDRASDEPDGFQTHVKLDHNMWNYLYFIFLLWEQDKDDDDGMEQYVRRAIDADEIVWFPLNKAIRLNQAATEEEVILLDIDTKLRVVENNLSKKLANFQAELNSLMEQLSMATKLECKSGEVKSSIAEFLISQSTIEKQVDDGAESVIEKELLNENLEVDEKESADEYGFDAIDSEIDEDGDLQNFVPLDDLNESTVDRAEYELSLTGGESNPRIHHILEDSSMESASEVLPVHNIENEEEEMETEEDEIAAFLKLSEVYAGGKLKVRSISVYGLKPTSQVSLDKKNCFLTVESLDQSFKSDAKFLLKGKKTAWANLNYCFNAEFQSMLTHELIIKVWEVKDAVETNVGTCIISLKKFSSHLELDLGTTVPLLTANSSQAAKVILVARFTPVRRLDFKVGDFIQAKYFNGNGKWHKGCIGADNGDGSYRVDYQDGDTEWNVLDSNIALFNESEKETEAVDDSSVFKFG